MCRGFAYVNLVSTDAKLGKCMNVLNGCAWRGGKLQISQAKPNRFRTLENGSIAIINEGDGKKQKKKPKRSENLYVWQEIKVWSLTRMLIKGKAGVVAVTGVPLLVSVFVNRIANF